MGDILVSMQGRYWVQTPDRRRPDQMSDEDLFTEIMCHLLATLPVHDERTRP